MRVFLPRLNVGPFVDTPVDEFEALAARDRFGMHRLVHDPEAADIILFTQCHMMDWRLQAVRTHPVAKHYWHKIAVYDERDRPWRSLPGVYVSMPKSSFDQRSQRSWGYYRIPDVPAGSPDPDLLYSFVGSLSHPSRTPLLGLRHRDGVIEEVSSFLFWETTRPDFEVRRERFTDILARTRFVLCPRGRGTSSYRIYEALAAGRVPVIISDEWVPPDGPDWQAISIRWPEGRIAELIEMLEARDADWPAMSRAALKAHRDFFDADVNFHRIVECCDDLQRLGLAAHQRRRTFRMRSFAAALAERTRDRRPARTHLTCRQ